MHHDYPLQFPMSLPISFANNPRKSAEMTESTVKDMQYKCSFQTSQKIFINKFYHRVLTHLTSNTILWMLHQNPNIQSKYVAVTAG